MVVAWDSFICGGFFSKRLGWWFGIAKFEAFLVSSDLDVLAFVYFDVLCEQAGGYGTGLLCMWGFLFKKAGMLICHGEIWGISGDIWSWCIGSCVLTECSMIWFLIIMQRETTVMLFSFLKDSLQLPQWCRSVRHPITLFSLMPYLGWDVNVAKFWQCPYHSQRSFIDTTHPHSQVRLSFVHNILIHYTRLEQGTFVPNLIKFGTKVLAPDCDENKRDIIWPQTIIDRNNARRSIQVCTFLNLLILL